MSASNKVRFGYVGAGFVAQTIHIPNFCALGDCEVTALAEVRQELGQHVAQRFGIRKLYKTHEELAADPEIEAVGVSAQYAQQGRIAEDLLRAGKHVFMEKPMTVSVTRAKAMVETARKSGKVLMVGYMKRYDPGNLRLKQHIEAWRQNGEAGRILLARNHGFGGNWVYAADPNVVFEKSPEAPPPAADDCPAWLPENRRNSYLGYLQQWTHNINLLRFFLGDENGRGVTKVKSVDLDQDGLTGILVLEINGHRAVVESGYTKFHAWDEHTTVYFEGGWLKTQAPALMHKQTPASVEIYRAGHGDRTPQLTQEHVTPAWSYREEARAFLQAVRGTGPNRSTAEDTLQDVQLYEDIYRTYLGL